ncbi:MAG: nickel pincer cofactor biosynthesis protein LarC [Bacteroidota bacterium]
MNTLYIEAFSGLSGDMFLGALAALLDAHDELKALPEQLALPDAKVKIKQVDKNGIVCQHVQVIDLNETKKQEHSHDHGHHHHSHHRPHRHLNDINAIIDNAKIGEEAKSIAKAIFSIIGKSESKIHNIPLEKIHFHEVSGVDSIIDIVGCAVLLAKLDITKTFATPICTGHGFVATQHGRLPVPAPATADILKGMPYYAGDEAGERTTPTGAAILNYLEPNFQVPVLTPIRTEYGPGSKDFIAPNVLRLSLCEQYKPEQNQDYILETNIDDMSPEMLGADFQEGLINAGALDFYLSPVQMKKGRSGLLLSCVVPKTGVEGVSNYIFQQTSTIGIRHYPVHINRLKRRFETVKTPFGDLKVKVSTMASGQEKYKVEYEDLKKMAVESRKSPYFIEKEINTILNKKYSFNPLKMKNKLTVFVLAMPLFTMAHPGHDHHIADILLDPLSWPHHGVLLVGLLILILFALRKVLRKLGQNAVKALGSKK